MGKAHDRARGDLIWPRAPGIEIVKILLDLGDRPLIVIGPPGSGKTTFVTTLAMAEHLMGMADVLYLTHKPKDAIGNIVNIKSPWGCVKNDLMLVLSAYEELSGRPGISLLAVKASKFYSFNAFIRYVYRLSRNPRNAHAQWLLERLRILEGYINDSNEWKVNGLNTVIYERNLKGVYQVMSLVSALINCSGKALFIVDDVTILPIRDDILLRLMRIVRGITNVWLVMHGLSKLSPEEINIPTAITYSTGLSKYVTKYQDLITKIKPGEILYIGEDIELKLKISKLIKMNIELRRISSTQHQHR